MKVLIIGAKGMLGQELAKVFADQNLSLWDKEDIDISDFDQVKNKIAVLRPDIIINSAAYNAVDDCETNYDLALKVNAQGSGNLAQAAQNIGAIFIHYSTDYVFDGLKKQGYTENDQPSPISKYGQSKFEGEKQALANCDKSYIIRLSRLFGQPAATLGAKKSFVDIMQQIAQEKKEIQVVNEEVSNPTYAPDLARQTRKILEGEYLPGIYHITNQGACTWHELAQEIFKILNKEIKVLPVSTKTFPRPAARPAFSSLINTKLPQMRPWPQALEEYLKNPNY